MQARKEEKKEKNYLSNPTGPLAAGRAETCVLTIISKEAVCTSFAPLLSYFTLHRQGAKQERPRKKKEGDGRERSAMEEYISFRVSTYKQEAAHTASP